jgi:mannose-6-phosphate isomerase-like protein (cupin superfamily)
MGARLKNPRGPSVLCEIHGMILTNLDQAKDRFEVLQTTEKSQTGVMTLAPGDSSSGDLNTHPRSDQVVLLLEGELTADIEGETRRMRTGDVVIVPAASRHRFTNSGASKARAFSVYVPPAY